MNLYTAEVIAKEQLTHTIWKLVVRLADRKAFNFKAGQCVGFHLGNGKKRLYSIASSPLREELEFCVDVSPNGLGSQFVLGLDVRNEFTIEGPYGGFYINNQEQSLLFVATGVGVAPFRGILEDVFLTNSAQNIDLLFGVRTDADLFYSNELREWAVRMQNVKVHITLSQPSAHWQGKVGRVTHVLDEEFEVHKRDLFYICGSTEMIKDTRSLLLAKGIQPKQIKLEIFA